MLCYSVVLGHSFEKKQEPVGVLASVASCICQSHLYTRQNILYHLVCSPIYMPFIILGATVFFCFFHSTYSFLIIRNPQQKLCHMLFHGLSLWCRMTWPSSFWCQYILLFTLHNYSLLSVRNLQWVNVLNSIFRIWERLLVTEMIQPFFVA